ncbi:MAG TPA: MarR family winged helix-turn-helix transcriptional regulator [Polyangiaceae bacterium]|jgi:DNA-binding MarR family transcriptional regulator
MQLKGGALETARILDNLRRIVRALRTSARDVERQLGIGGAQLFVLSELAAEPGISIRRLSERTLTDPSSASVVAARLVARRLVARRRDRQDARRSVLSLTPRGRALLARAPEPFQVRLVSALRGLPGARLRRLDLALTELVRVAGADRGAAPMFFSEESKEPKRRTRRGA